MSLDVAELTATMLQAFKDELSDKWPAIKGYAETEAQKLAENFAMIERLRLAGDITPEQARLHHEIQRNASRTVLLAVKGLSLVAVEQAINAAMNALKDSVNGALNFTLL
jgi:hypothetical protein